MVQLIALEKERTKYNAPLNRVIDIQEQLEKKKKAFSSLYFDYKEGILDRREFLSVRETYQVEIAALEQQLSEMQSTRSRTRKAEMSAHKWESLVRKYRKVKSVTPELIEAMVEEIRFNADGSIDIDFKYMNEFEEMFQECERIKKEVA